MPFPFGKYTTRPRVWPASAGTWRASTGYRKLRRPASPGMETFTRRVMVPIGIDGQASGPVGASGSVTLQAGPAGVGATWALDQAGVATSVGATDTATCNVYVGPLPTAPYQVATSYAGGGDAVGLAGYSLQPGEFVFAVWASGTPGSTAQLKVSGDKSVLA